MSAPTDDAVGRVQKELDRQRSWGGMAWVDAPRVSVPTDALRAVLARLAECEADKLRLDYLEANKPGFALIADIGGPWQIEITVGERDDCQSWEAPTYRQAIDHAMRGGANG